jgi:signal transduction histidine kinase
VVGPLQALAAGARAVARGEYGHTVPVGGPVEVRELATTFNRMSQQVRAGQQAQRDFVANVSHELRTPLTSIQGFSQAILDGAAGEPQAVAHAAGIIHAEAQRLRRMADDLLELARLDAGQITLRREPVELAALLRACAERLEPRAREAGVALALELPAGLPGVIGDGDRLAQVFTNLLDNALQHTPAGGQVTLSAAAATGGVVVRVRDSGRGIPADDLARIFERFYQVDKSRRRAQGGAGLGLAIVRELVQAHGGTVSAESAEGLGTTFLVTLPARS